MAGPRNLANVADTIGGTSNLSVDGSVLFVDVTNNRVGIGTSTPLQVLHVVGNANVSGSIIQNGIDTRSFAIAMSTALSI
jgi:hypothetical protein